MDAPWMQVFLGLDGYEPAQACSSSSSHPLINGQEEAMDVEDAPRLEFLCPHCYSQFDIASLCSHLDDEHCFQSKPLLCPVCAAKVSDDLVGHITLQHGNLFKMHRRKRGAPRKSSEACSANLSLDPLLSSLYHDFLASDDSKASDIPGASDKEETRMKNLPSQTRDTSLEAQHGMKKKSEEKQREEELRAKFVQQMMLSTIFHED